MRVRSTSTHSAAPSSIVTASGCAPPMPPSPAVTTSRPGERAAEALAARPPRTSRRCPGGSPGCRCRSRTRPSSGRTSSARRRRARGSAPRSPTRPTRFELAISTRGARSCVSNTRDRLARLHEQRLVVAEAHAARGGSSRRRRGRAPPCRCRRRRSAPPAARPRRDAGCSRASAGRPPAASRGSAARRAGSSQHSRDGFDGGRQRAGSRRAPRRRRGRGEEAVGPGPATRSRSAASAAAVPAPGSQRRRAGRARGRAHQLDGEDARQVGDAPRAACARRPSPSRRGPPASRSSGSESTPAGRGEAPVLGHHRRLRVLGEHQARVRRPASCGQERRQAVGARRVQQPVGAALGDRADVGGGDREEVAGERRAARRGSCRTDSTRPSGQDHRVVDRALELAPRRPRRRGRARRGRRRGPAACSAASRRPARAGRPRGGWRRSASRRSSARRFAALAGLAGLRAQRDQVLGEGAVGAEQRLDASCAAVTSAARSRTRGRAARARSMPSMPSVPLVSARPSLAVSVERRDAGAPRAPRRRRSVAVRRR